MSQDSPVFRALVDRASKRRSLTTVTLALPLYVGVGDPVIPVATLQLNQANLLAALRLRLYEGPYSGRPLWRVLNTWPGLSAASTNDEISEVLRRIVELVVHVASLIVRLELLIGGLHAGRLDLRLVMDKALGLTVKSTRFCSHCGSNFTFSKSRRKYCGRPSCTPPPKPRARPGHAKKVAAGRYRKLVATMGPVYNQAVRSAGVEAPSAERAFAQYIADDEHAEQLIETLAEANQGLASLVTSLSRYRARGRRTRALRR